MNKSDTIKTFAIVLASGSGSRFNSEDCPKHLIKIKDVPTIIWTLDSVLGSKIFDKVVVVTREKDLKNTNEIISKYFNTEELKLLFTVGGNDRMQSFFNGVLKISEKAQIEDNDLVALIDSNRPFCSIKQLKDLNNLATENGCSCPARPVVNGVAKIISNKITEVPAKDNYVEFVTPEFLEYQLLDKSKKKNKTFKSLVEYSLDMSVNPIFLTSSDLNSKLTYPEDLVFLEGLVNKYNLAKPLKKNEH